MNYINYKNIVDEAMRTVVKNIIEKVIKEGLGEGQHCYISFQTHFPEVILSDSMREKYPEEMTIVLQHQFWNLKLENEGFFVDLSFDNKMQTIFAPFKSITYFLDPSENFAIPLEKIEIAKDNEDKQEINIENLDENDKSNNVIPLDVFRKKP